MVPNHTDLKILCNSKDMAPKPVEKSNHDWNYEKSQDINRNSSFERSNKQELSSSVKSEFGDSIQSDEQDLYDSKI